MVKVGFLVRLEVKPGKAAELEARLQAALPAIEQEPGTTAWFAVRLGPSSYAVFDGRSVRFHRVEYDVRTTMDKIYATPGLPNYLADRLIVGR